MTITIFLAKYLIFFSPLILLFYFYKKINTNKNYHLNLQKLQNSEKQSQENYIQKLQNKFKNNYKDQCGQLKIHFKEMILVGLSGIFSWILASEILKNIFKLNRPNFKPNLKNDLIIPNLDIDYAFPSGHTTFMIALATALYSYDKKLGIITFILGLLIGFSRVIVGLHFARDIFGGIIFGLILGFIFIKILRKYF